MSDVKSTHITKIASKYDRIIMVHKLSKFITTIALAANYDPANADQHAKTLDAISYKIRQMMLPFNVWKCNYDYYLVHELLESNMREMSNLELEELYCFVMPDLNIQTYNRIFANIPNKERAKMQHGKT